MTNGQIVIHIQYINITGYKSPLQSITKSSKRVPKGHVIFFLLLNDSHDVADLHINETHLKSERDRLFSIVFLSQRGEKRQKRFLNL